MKYILEIYKPDNRLDVCVMLESPKPFMTIHPEDVISPYPWPDRAGVKGDLVVTGIEHLVWEGHEEITHKIMVFTKERPREGHAILTPEEAPRMEGTMSEDSTAPTREAILASLEHLLGDGISTPKMLAALGYPEQFWRPLAQTYIDDPDDPQRMLRFEDGQRLEHVYGVHDLNLLEAVARLVGASIEGDPDADAAPVANNADRKRRARCFHRAIRRALGEPA